MNNYILEKRTAEAITYDLDCTNILDLDEVILTVNPITADQDGLTFTQGAVNSVPVTFPNGFTAAVGKVISTQIGGGVIPAPQINQLYTIRAVFVTNSGNTREATVLLNVTNLPVQTGRVV